MIKRLTSLIIMFLCVLPAFSQNDGTEGKLKNIDSLSIDNNLNYGIAHGVTDDGLFFLRLKAPISNFKTINSYSFDTKEIYQDKALPIYSNYNFLLQSEFRKGQPLANDFIKTQANKIFNKLYLYSGSRQVTHIAYGEYYQINGGLRWLPNNKLSVDVGSFLSRQYDYVTAARSDILGINTKTSYNLTNKIQFNIFGQYTAPSQKNFFYGNSLFPNSTVGSSLLFNLKNRTQIDMGVKYRYYENKMSWNIESVGKISVGF
ncbi:MAG TPA: hypothetical protein VMV56_04920 [Williamwhitmania sp.]|nr:hypothetical protein [Williamwhitmania sp.]